MEDLSIEEFSENLRLKYRAEAIQACQTAKTVGYELAQQESESKIRELKAKYKKLKEISEENSADNIDYEPFKVSLVKSVMENVYSNVKGSLNNETDNIQVIKTSLLESSNTLKNDVNKIDFSKLIHVSTNRPKPQQLISPIHNSHHAGKIYRPKILMVNGETLPVSIHIITDIPTVIMASETKKYTSYIIKSTVQPLLGNLGNGLAVKIYQQERRYNEFCDLYEILKRLYPLSIIPNLPPKNIIGEKANESWMLETRRRQLKFWLQYILNHGALQICSKVQQFIAGSETIVSSDFNIQSKSLLIHGISETQNDILNNLASDNQGEGEGAGTGAGAGAGAGAARSSYELAAAPMNEKLTGLKDGYSQHSIENARRELVTISRDLMQLEPQACSATAACVDLISIFDKLEAKTILAGSAFESLSQFEKDCSYSKSVWGLFSKGLTVEKNSRPEHYDKNSLVHTKLEILLEALSFFNGSCMQSSRTNIDRVYSMRSSCDKRVEGSDIAVKEWRCLRDSRHKMLTEVLRDLTNSFMMKHLEEIDSWSHVLSEVENLHYIPAPQSVNTTATTNTTTTTTLSSSSHEEGHKTGKHNLPQHNKSSSSSSSSSYTAQQLPDHSSTTAASDPIKMHSSVRPLPNNTSKIEKANDLSGRKYDVTSARTVPKNITQPIIPKQNNLTSTAPSTASVPTESPSEAAPTPIPPKPSVLNPLNWLTSALTSSLMFKKSEVPQDGPDPATVVSSSSSATKQEDKIQNPQRDSLTSTDQKVYANDQQQKQHHHQPPPQTIHYQVKNEIKVQPKNKRLQPKKRNPTGDLPDTILSDGLNAPLTQPPNAGYHVGKKVDSSYLDSFQETPVNNSNSCTNNDGTRPPPNMQKNTAPINPKAFDYNNADEVSSKPPPVNVPTSYPTTAQQHPSSSSHTHPESESNIRSPDPSFQNTQQKNNNKHVILHTNQSSSTHTTIPPVTQTVESNLADGWEEVTTEDGRTYYYHKVTRVSRWDRPDVKIMEAVQARIQESEKQVNEAVMKRKMEREEENRILQEKVAVTDKIQLEVKNTIQKWRMINNNKSKNIEELLNSVDIILPSCVAKGSIVVSVSQPAQPSDIKKAYMKIVRLIHPDKLSAELDLRTKILAEAVFIFLTETFDAYRKAFNL